MDINEAKETIRLEERGPRLVTAAKVLLEEVERLEVALEEEKGWVKLDTVARFEQEIKELKLRARAAEDVVKRYVASYHRGKGFPQAWISENCGDLAKEEITKRLAELKEQKEKPCSTQ